MKYLITLLIVLLPSIYAQAQNYQAFGNEHLVINQTGMYALGGWSLANLVSGGIGWHSQMGEKKYFHQMNFMWNTVNAGIVIGAMFSIGSKDYTHMSDASILSDQFKSQKLFLINAGLDIFYIGGGLVMYKIGQTKERQKDRLTGYGKSVVLQGSFLLVFDGILYLLQRNHRMEFLDNLSLGMTSYGGQIGYAMDF